MDIQEKLPEDMVTIEYFYTADTIYSFWITQDQFFQVSIANDKGFGQTIESYVQQCRDPMMNLSDEMGWTLYQKLLQKGLSRISDGISRLCIIPDGTLHNIPFEALNVVESGKRQFLIENYSVSYSYSIGLLFRKKKRSTRQAYLGFGTKYSSTLNEKLKKRRLLFGNSNLSRLVLSQEEINRAAAIFSGDLFIEKDATLENFYKHSANARIIHLSLHGLVDMDDPLRSSILFDDNDSKFVLSASDLYSHKINADLVVLSACHSASGKIFNGEGVQGMSKAFVLSGAKSILSSLWSASEASSLRIMTSFLQNIHDEKPNDLALNEAKLKYLSSVQPSQQHPSYWANFILIGEINTNEPSSVFLTGKTALALSFFILVGIFFFIRTKSNSSHLPLQENPERRRNAEIL